MMKQDIRYTLNELAERVDGTVHGDGDLPLTGINTLEAAQAGEISFFTDGRYREQLQQTRASAVIIAPEFVADLPCNGLVVASPYLTYARIAQLFAPTLEAYSGIHPSAVVAEDASIDSSASIGAHCVVEAGARIGKGAILGAGCYVGQQSRIGEDSRIYPHVSVYHGVHIGQRAIIHSGTIIGSDGFGFANDQGQWHKIPQLGGVFIGDDVEIGANTTVDRGALEDTVIGDGVKLDNQIQIAHNVKIGEHTAIAGCVGIAGSAKIGRFCGIGGGAGILGHLEIVDGVQVTAMSLVTKSISEPGIYSSGTSVEPTQQWHRNYARFRHLDDMAKRLKKLEKIVSEQNKE